MVALGALLVVVALVFKDKISDFWGGFLLGVGTMLELGGVLLMAKKITNVGS